MKYICEIADGVYAVSGVPSHSETEIQFDGNLHRLRKEIVHRLGEAYENECAKVLYFYGKENIGA